ncbi:MAG: hypothetical protein JW770_07935 [Actinobacteria bacterium]|nr:hypothetical protein [Actinomycetota bacterium]
MSESCFPRNYAYPEQIERAADYIYSQFEKTEGLVTGQKYTVEGIEYRNIIVRFGHDNGKQIVIGAHYDVYNVLPGANDDASIFL